MDPGSHFASSSGTANVLKSSTQLSVDLTFSDAMKLSFKSIFKRPKKLLVDIDPSMPLSEKMQAVQINKLHAETVDLNRHFWKNLAAVTSFAVGVGTISAAGVGLWFTWKSDWFDSKRTLLQAERERLSNDVARLEDRKKDYETAITGYSNQVVTLLTSVSNLNQSIVVLQATNQAIQESLQSYSVVTNALAFATVDLATARTNVYWLLNTHFGLISNVDFPPQLSNLLRRNFTFGIRDPYTAPNLIGIPPQTVYNLLNNARIKSEAAAAQARDAKEGK